MNFLIDTNVISEIRKGPRCDQNVATWYESLDDRDLYLSVLVLGEIRKGIERVRPRDSTKAALLDWWLVDVSVSFGDRILPVDRAVADEWGCMSAIRSIPAVDCLLAATAKVHRMTLATRNAAHVVGLGATCLNPFEPATRSGA